MDYPKYTKSKINTEQSVPSSTRSIPATVINTLRFAMFSGIGAPQIKKRVVLRALRTLILDLLSDEVRKHWTVHLSLSLFAGREGRDNLGPAFLV